MQRRSVVLPQPLGPTTETNSPAGTLKSDAIENSLRAIAGSKSLSLEIDRQQCAAFRRRYYLSAELGSAHYSASEGVAPARYIARDPPEKRIAEFAEHADRDHANDHVGRPVEVARIPDEPAEAV